MAALLYQNAVVCDSFWIFISGINACNDAPGNMLQEPILAPLYNMLDGIGDNIAEWKELKSCILTTKKIAFPPLNRIPNATTTKHSMDLIYWVLIIFPKISNDASFVVRSPPHSNCRFY